MKGIDQTSVTSNEHDMTADPSAGRPSATTLALDLIRLARPWHWVKNGFILLPLPFALAAGATLDAALFATGLLGFSLLSSAIYVFNDLLDAEADRLNPRKSNRPVASGVVSIPMAASMSVSLACAGLALCWMTGERLVFVLATAYLLSNIVYSTGAKNLPMVDVFILASGFLIRVLIGCALLDTQPSNWLLLCSSALALFLAFSKRRGDLIEGMDENHRKSLAGYSVAYLDQVMVLCAGTAVLAYALYSQEAPVFIEGRELAGLPFVAFAVLDYLRMVFTSGRGASPVEIVYRAVPLQICGLAWLGATAWSLGFV